MSESWRIKTVEKDNTEKALTSTPIVGVTAIISPKGPKTFTRFNKGDTQGILNTFGYPSKDYPTIQDALDIITKCSMWIASPYKNGTYGGVFVTKSMGTISFNQGVSTKEISDYEKVSFINQIGIGDGYNTSFTYTVDKIAKYNKESLKLFIDGVEHVISISTLDNIETISDSGEGAIIDSGSTLNTSTGVLTLNFTAPIPNGNTISIGYTMDMSDTYFVLFDKNMQADDLRVKVILSEDVDNAFEINVERFDPVSLEYITVNNSPFVVGLSETSKDTYGDNIYIENIFGDKQQLFDAHVVTSVLDTFANDSTFVALNGGSRGDTVGGSDVATLYDQIKDTSKYQIKFCFDGTCYSDVVTKYESLRNSYQKRCRFLYPTTDVDGATIVESPTTYNYGVTANRGLYQYCLTWGIHQDIYQGNDFKCSNMGLIASRLVDALNNGTGCPAWIDENGVGGILGSSITKLSQEVTPEDILEQLDNLNFNAVVNDFNYGPMIVGWRTRQVKKTVYSNIPQSSLADTIIELIVNQVLPSRIGKMIDESTYSVVRSGCNQILSTYSQFLEDYYVWCDGDNNTPEMREKEELVVTVGVSFKNYARTILLTFSSYRNGVDVKEEMTKQ